MTWSGAWFGLVIAALILGAVAGFFGARWFFKRQLQKNPPITEQQIRLMYQSMGRKPSEKEIRRIMNQMKNSN